MEDICGYQIFIIVTDTNNSKDKYKYNYQDTSLFVTNSYTLGVH